MQTPTRNALTANAQVLRRNMTKEERHLWYDCLKHLPVSFARQKVIGRYIVDFYCAEARLVVELDGAQHTDPEKSAADAKRDDDLRRRGLTILRYANTDIARNFRGVCEDIMHHLPQNEEETRRFP